MEKKVKRLEVKAGREYIIKLGDLNPFDGSYPTKSVTELVRCKDCKNREYYHDPFTDEIRNDRFFCKNIGYSSRFDFFCSNGKRKDDKQDGVD